MISVCDSQTKIINLKSKILNQKFTSSTPQTIPQKQGKQTLKFLESGYKTASHQGFSFRQTYCWN